MKATLLTSLFAGLACAAPFAGKADIKGATYTMSNEVSNTIIINAIHEDGTLSYANSVLTGGVGPYMVNHTDPLFSQDSVLVSGNKLFAINAISHTLSLFKIDRSDPTHISLERTIDTQGEYPVSVAYSPRLSTACVVNGGKRNGVKCFRIMDTVAGRWMMGGINEMSYDIGLNQTTPATGPAGSVSDIVFSPDESSIIVSIKGTPMGPPGYLITLPIHNNRFLSPVFSTPMGGTLPFSITPIHNTGLLVTDPAIGAEIFALDRGQPSWSQPISIPNNGATCWSAYSQTTGSHYAIDAMGRVTELRIDERSLRVQIGQQLQFASKSALDGAVARVGRYEYLYVLAPAKQAITVVRLDGPGRMSVVQEFDMQSGGGGALGLTNIVAGMAVAMTA
ncbi:hypothetical protein HDV00_008531 [Rhizophlyctis rosea]|nr:hypothetical protein HDV00_008531 [Rhizophlyctis rosea]